MSVIRIHVLMIALVTSSAVIHAQGAPVAAAPSTLWNFLGIPQGFQKIRDVTANRRGNRPRMERRDPIKRIADPANLESENPAIKEAAKIKQAEDMKMQKIKAIKYLAEIGCGCYNKNGEITEALLAATDDCTPDVRKASLEAIEEAASGECCKKCGSTSCCNEKISMRLSEIAYERDDTGCHVEQNEEIRALAKRVLRICCPGGQLTGPIEEEIEEPETVPVPIPDEEPLSPKTDVPGESGEKGEAIEGESSGDEEVSAETNLSGAVWGQGDSVILRRASMGRGISMSLSDLNNGHLVSPAPSTLPTTSAYLPPPVRVVPIPQGSSSTARAIKFEPVRRAKPLPAKTTRLHRLQSANDSGFAPVKVRRFDPVKRASLVKEATLVKGSASDKLQRMNPTRDMTVTQVNVEAPPVPNRKIVPAYDNGPIQQPRFDEVVPPNATRPQFAPRSSYSAPATKIIGSVVSVSYDTGLVLLEGTLLKRLDRDATGDLYHRDASGSVRLGSVIVRETGTTVRAQVMDRSKLKAIQLGDRVVFKR